MFENAKRILLPPPGMQCVAEHQSQTWVRGGGSSWAGAAALKALPQPEVFTACDISTVQKDGKVTITGLKRRLEKKGQILQR